MAPMNLAQLPKKPALLLQQWLDEAARADVVLPTVASLATAQLPSGRVSNRMVNVKEVNSSGSVVIYSDFTRSRKGNDLRTNPHAALTFYWQKLNRSARVEGQLQFMSKKESEPYFNARGKQFRASVLVGEQSQPVEDRQELVDRFQRVLAKEDPELVIPDYWFGAELVPDWVEFYEDSSDRLSDRVTYTRNGDEWMIQRISP